MDLGVTEVAAEGNALIQCPGMQGHIQRTSVLENVKCRQWITMVLAAVDRRTGLCGGLPSGGRQTLS